MSDVSPCLESQSCHLIPLSFSCHFSANGPFFFNLFSRKLQHISLRGRLLYMALVEQLADGRWYMQLAAIWRWYLP